MRCSKGKPNSQKMYGDRHQPQSPRFLCWRPGGLAFHIYPVSAARIIPQSRTTHSWASRLQPRLVELFLSLKALSHSFVLPCFWVGSKRRRRKTREVRRHGKATGTRSEARRRIAAACRSRRAAHRARPYMSPPPLWSLLFTPLCSGFLPASPPVHAGTRRIATALAGGNGGPQPRSLIAPQRAARRACELGGCCERGV